MDDGTPEVLVIAGPNGAGKSTCASKLLPEGLEYLNADEVAIGLPGYPSPSVDIQAGRIILARMDQHERRAESFAIETTLATRSLATRIGRLRRFGYRFRLLFIWSPSVDFSIGRVAARVRAGGHSIPEETIRRRYEAGLRNFRDLYQPMADSWDLFDNSRPEALMRIASGSLGSEIVIGDQSTWSKVIRRGDDERQ